jgi:hypothetical protein
MWQRGKKKVFIEKKVTDLNYKQNPRYKGKNPRKQFTVKWVSTKMKIGWGHGVKKPVVKKFKTIKEKTDYEKKIQAKKNIKLERKKLRAQWKPDFRKITKMNFQKMRKNV